MAVGCQCRSPVRRQSAEVAGVTAAANRARQQPVERALHVVRRDQIDVITDFAQTWRLGAIRRRSMYAMPCSWYGPA